VRDQSYPSFLSATSFLPPLTQAMRFKASKPPSVPALLPTRGYQQEMLEESLVKNIVIALDTGSGKTHIAVLRMKHECEHQQDKVCIHSYCPCHLLIVAVAVVVPCPHRLLV
jgi:hypothetical protein